MTEVRRQTMKLLVSPFLCFASVVPAFVGVMVVFVSIEYGGVLYRYADPLYRYDYVTPSLDEIGLALILVIGGLIFWTFGRALIFLERLERPRLIDHLRHCACLYVFFAILTASLMPEFVKAYRVRGYPHPEFQSQVFWLLAGCAILADALVLVRQRRRNTRLAFGVEP